MHSNLTLTNNYILFIFLLNYINKYGSYFILKFKTTLYISRCQIHIYYFRSSFLLIKRWSAKTQKSGSAPFISLFNGFMYLFLLFKLKN